MSLSGLETTIDPADDPRLFQNDSHSTSPYVVGIGASAGGLEALERFFDNVPKSSGMAFVVVQHLSPDFKSLMDEILARRTTMPVQLVEDGMLVEANHIYLMPPKKEMIISGGRLLLSERDRDQELSLPIDVFFRSLAQDCGPRAIAVVLSGGGSDGSRGIRAVHEAGGLVVVQDVESAQFDGMPKTAREAGVADYVVPPQDMPGVLFEHTHRVGTSGDGGTAAEHGMQAVYGMLEQEFGIDFTHYKPSTVTRRIERRLQLAQVDDIDTYVEKLRGEHKELDSLYRDLLIGVTRFFRNEEAFDVLEKEVLPELLRNGPQDAPFRVWVPGCATGEEVYSLAILLHELTQESGRPFKIFASDVHRGSLEQATRALYEEDAIGNVSPERLKRYFLPRGRSYQVVPDLRQTVVFAHHNVIKDAPFTRVDLVSCRNMLIYLQPPAQEKVLSLFHFALNRGGMMFLGPSESLGHLDHDFETIHKTWRIYRKFSDSRTSVDRRMAPPRKSSGVRFGTGLGVSPLAAPGAGRHSVSQLLGTYDALLDELMPPSLLIDDHGELIHTFSGATRFLKLREGRQGLDVYEMVDPELKMLLVSGVQRALKENAAIVFEGVRTEEGMHKVTVRRIHNKRAPVAHVLISFESEADTAERTPLPQIEIDIRQVSREQLGAIEAELTRTKENLQAATEELETSNEELQAANEELLASNEELQSTNEELQSVNEELYSVNAEYQRKIADLIELANDMDNLLSSTDIGTIFLDRELKIRKFTPQISESFKLLPQDIGRPIETFTYAVDHPELNEDLKRVLATGERVERELRDRHGRAFFLRILPYRAKGSVDGVVLTLIDVSGLKAAEDALFHERYLLNSLLHSIPDAIYFKDARGRFIRTNPPMAERLGLSDPRQAAGKTGFELSSHEAALAVHEQDEIVLRSGTAQHYRLEKRERPDGGVEWDLVTRLPLTDSASRIVGIIGIFRSVTEQKRAEEKINDAVRRRDEFLAMLSHELRNPLGAVVSAAALMKNGSEPARGKLLDIIERQAQQMARLLDDLLEASRVTQDKIELRKTIVDLRNVVKDAIDAMKNSIHARGLELAVEIGDEPLYVDGDPARLQQISVNLLSNAAKYTPRGGHVGVRVQREDGAAMIRVRDDGMGIPKEMLDSVFDLFVQSSRTLDRAEGGLGVGLTLVRGLVAKHGGSVSARSDGPGKGSEFSVRLPIASQPQHSEVGAPSSVPKLARGARVVVIEDNQDSREMLCALLSHAGLDCKSSDNGATGVALIEEFKPLVAIVDIGLPGLDGLEVARRVRANPEHKNIYLIALTGYGQRTDREMALRAGFDEHLVKPVDFATLTRVLGTSKEVSSSAN
ncbi:MAG: chemotaxis protein CheB [Myxococcota bacterium]